MVFIVEIRMVVNVWFWFGNIGVLSNCKVFIDEIFEILKDKKVGLIWVDSGFYSYDFMKYLEMEKLINYIFVVKMYFIIK